MAARALQERDSSNYRIPFTIRPAMFDKDDPYPPVLAIKCACATGFGSATLGLRVTDPRAFPSPALLRAGVWTRPAPPLLCHPVCSLKAHDQEALTSLLRPKLRPWPPTQASYRLSTFTRDISIYALRQVTL